MIWADRGTTFVSNCSWYLCPQILKVEKSGRRTVLILPLLQASSTLTKKKRKKELMSPWHWTWCACYLKPSSTPSIHLPCTSGALGLCCRSGGLDIPPRWTHSPGSDARELWRKWATYDGRLYFRLGTLQKKSNWVEKVGSSISVSVGSRRWSKQMISAPRLVEADVGLVGLASTWPLGCPKVVFRCYSHIDEIWWVNISFGLFEDWLIQQSGDQPQFNVWAF